jgi:hypothetical protein
MLAPQPSYVQVLLHLHPYASADVEPVAVARGRRPPDAEQLPTRPARASRAPPARGDPPGNLASPVPHPYAERRSGVTVDP